MIDIIDNSEIPSSTKQFIAMEYEIFTIHDEKFRVLITQIREFIEKDEIDFIATLFSYITNQNLRIKARINLLQYNLFMGPRVPITSDLIYERYSFKSKEYEMREAVRGGDIIKFKLMIINQQKIPPNIQKDALFGGNMEIFSLLLHNNVSFGDYMGEAIRVHQYDIIYKMIQLYGIELVNPILCIECHNYVTLFYYVQTLDSTILSYEIITNLSKNKILNRELIDYFLSKKVEINCHCIKTISTHIPYKKDNVEMLIEHCNDIDNKTLELIEIKDDLNEAFKIEDLNNYIEYLENIYYNLK